MMLLSIVAASGVLAVLLALLWVAHVVIQETGKGRIPCLLYHQLHPRGAAPPADLDPVYVTYTDRFTEQMQFLRDHGYATLSMEELMDGRSNPAKMASKPVVVTFDDGFAGNYLHGLPVLRRNGQRATLFMTPDRESANFRAFAHLDRPLTDHELREMSASGFDVQSHALTHRFLTELDDADLRHELEAAREAIESVTRRAVRFLAIPGGAYDRRVRRFAAATGHTAVFCMRKGSVGPRTDPFSLPRMVVSRDMTLEEFRSLLTPASWIQGRIASAPQELLCRVLGMRRVDALRDRLYRSALAPLLRPKRVALVVVGGALLVTALLVAIVRALAR